jgi:hypothetical protein
VVDPIVEELNDRCRDRLPQDLPYLFSFVLDAEIIAEEAV